MPLCPELTSTWPTVKIFKALEKVASVYEKIRTNKMSACTPVLSLLSWFTHPLPSLAPSEIPCLSFYYYTKYLPQGRRDSSVVKSMVRSCNVHEFACQYLESGGSQPPETLVPGRHNIPGLSGHLHPHAHIHTQELKINVNFKKMFFKYLFVTPSLCLHNPKHLSVVTKQKSISIFYFRTWIVALMCAMG